MDGDDLLVTTNRDSSALATTRDTPGAVSSTLTFNTISAGSYISCATTPAATA